MQMIFAHAIFILVLGLHLFIAIVRRPSNGGTPALRWMNFAALILFIGIYFLAILTFGFKLLLPQSLVALMAGLRGLTFPLIIAFAYIILGGIPLMAYFRELDRAKRQSCQN